jgi:rhamnulose-1-phosphate aldolase
MEKEINEIKEAAGILCEKGWAEMHAGNISYRLDDGSMIVSAAGSSMKKLHDNFEENALQVKDNGREVEFIRFTGKEVTPTSELATHLALHQYIKENDLKYKVILHTHPDEIIALTQIKNFNSSSAINTLLWNILPESKLSLPQGVAFVKYYTTGSRKLAEKTASALVKSNFIVWEKHGCIVASETAEAAIDLIEVVVKAIKIFFIVRNAGFIPEGLTRKQLEELENI